MRHHYNGKASKRFWDRVNAVQNKRIRDALYSMACGLQNVESQVLKMLSEVEAKKPRRRS
jgi:hypothetical protein